MYSYVFNTQKKEFVINFSPLIVVWLVFTINVTICLLQNKVKGKIKHIRQQYILDVVNFNPRGQSPRIGKYKLTNSQDI